MIEINGKFLERYISDDFFIKSLSIILYPKQSLTNDNTQYIIKFFQTIEKDVSIVFPHQLNRTKRYLHFFIELLGIKLNQKKIFIDYENIIEYFHDQLDSGNNYTIKELVNIVIKEEKINDDGLYNKKYNEFLEEIQIYTSLKIADKELSELYTSLFENNNNISSISQVDTLKKTIENLYFNFSEIQYSSNDGDDDDLIYFDEKSIDKAAEITTKYLSEEFVILKTGIEHIDNNIDGLLSASLMLIGAPSNHGKSTFLNFIMYSLLKNNKFDNNKKNVIIEYVFEDVEFQSQTKKIITFGNIESGLIKKINYFFNNDLDNNGLKGPFKDFLKNLFMKSFYPLINNRVTYIIKKKKDKKKSINDIIKDCEKLKFQGYNILLITVDYLDKMDASNKKDMSDYVKYGEITDELRNLAQSYKIPIISPTQLQRDAADLTKPLTRTLVSDSKLKFDNTDNFILLRLHYDNIREKFPQIPADDIDYFILLEFKIIKSKIGNNTDSLWMIFNKGNLRYYTDIDTAIKENEIMKKNTLIVQEEFEKIKFSVQNISSEDLYQIDF